MEPEKCYEALIPTDNAQNLEEYQSALKWALGQKGVVNIAVTGPYGSGKSSVINSFLRKRGKNDYLHISLAAFNLNAQNNGDGVIDDDKEKKAENITDEKRVVEIGHETIIRRKKSIDIESLENSILKQLFYSVSTSDIPHSRYRKIESENMGKTIFDTIGVTIVLAAILFFAIPDKMDAFFNRVNSIHCATSGLISLVLAVTFVVFVFRLLQWFKRNGSIKEIRIFDKATIGNADGVRESVFNRNIDEILYFFEQTQRHIVVFEDLDRFNRTDIFVALRELNGLLNKCPRIKREVKFVYAIRDDLFEKGERTKFFDFIIPIVPYINSGNSAEELRKRLKFDDKTDCSTIHDVSGRFISMISPYISNMRDLICICNEFDVYKNTIKSNQELQLSDEKMFAIVVFKNLYPKDFAELEDEMDTSIVRQAFADKRTHVNKTKEMKEKLREEQEERLAHINGEVMRGVRELKAAFLSSLVEPPAVVYQLGVENKTYTTTDVFSNDFDMNQLKVNRIAVYTYNGSGNPRHIDNIEEKIKEKGDYFTRIDNLRQGLEESRDESRRIIEAGERRIDELRSYPICSLIEEEGTGFLNELVKQNTLLVFLLRHGYLDENYHDYINYFHPNSITKDEMNFILGVRDHNWTKGYDFPLPHVSRVYDRMLYYDFMQKEILNFELVDYVLSEKENTFASDKLFKLLSDHSENSMSFIKAYLHRDRKDNIGAFIRNICRHNDCFWNDIINDNGIARDTRCEYLVLILKYADMDDIVLQDQEIDGRRILTGYLTENPDAMKSIITAPVDKQIELLNRLDVVFRDLDTDTIDECILESIFDNCRYELNPRMIERLFAWKESQLVSDLSRKNYSSVLKLGYAPLIKYIHSNFTEYVSNLIVDAESNTGEEIEVVEDILTRLLPDEEQLCFAVLDKEPVIWSEITRCCADCKGDSDELKKRIWGYLLQNDRIVASWNNVISYYDLCGPDANWVNYFERHIDDLLNDDNSLITDEVRDELMCINVSDDCFRKYVTSIMKEQFRGNLSNLNEGKIRIMIEEKMIPVSKEYWIEMGQAAPSLRILYAESDSTTFLPLIKAISIDEDEKIGLLKSKLLSNTDKVKILELLPPTSINASMALAIKELDFVIKRQLFDAAWRVLDVEGKREILLNQLDGLNNDELPALFKQLAEEYHPLAKRTKHKVKLEYTEYNEKLLETIKAKDYITSFSAEEDKKGLPGDRRKVYSVMVKQAT